ncbi:MAG: Gfo/Idh/MocA family oxidoreductase [Candidatus Omnitrophica bacterium]|nr:Gfo/Idh/MocA family oxidoreductase [Candidatus Omnitrophota bacterium]
MEKLYTAVIGVGHLGSKHAKVYSSLRSASLVGVSDTNEERGKRTAHKYHTKYYSEYRDLFDKVEAVSIAVPTFLHYKIAKDFLDHGIHVLIEKPITKTIEEADELLALAKKKNLIIQVGHIERFNSAVIAIEPFIKEPRFIECNRLGPFVQRAADIGVVLDLMIHDIDIILSLIKSHVINIEAVGVKIVSDHEDTANVRMTFANKTICDLTASRVTKKSQRTIKISQEDSFINLNYLTESAILYKKKLNRLKKKKINIKKEEPLKRELQSFADCVLNNKRPIVSGEEAREALSVAIDITKQIKAKLNE